MKFKLLATTAIATALALGTTAAFAAGFAVREQSAQYQGTSFAGNGAGTGLSVMFWNAAGAANVSGPGIHTESHFSLILPNSEVHVDSVSASGITAADVTPGLIAGGATPVGAAILAPSLAANLNASIDASFASASPNSDNIAIRAVVPASYASYEVFNNVFVGVATNSGFGLGTEPGNNSYKGSVLGRTTKLFTTNVNPTIAMNIMPGVSVGVGAQIQFGTGKLKFATGIPGASSTSFRGDGWAFGATAGIIIKPLEGTRIGVGWRSRLRQHLKGKFATPGLTVDGGTATGNFPLPSPPFPPGTTVPIAAQIGGVPLAGANTIDAEATIYLPDTVTVSFVQQVSDKLSVSGTFEWANWSGLDEIRLTRQSNGKSIQVIETKWDDSYFYALGFDYDYSPTITVRSGIAYEISPTSAPDKRLTSIPDANRLWLSFGGTYHLSEEASMDFAYTHIFIEDARFDRHTTTGATTLTGTVESSVDIISGSFKSKF